MSVLIIGCVPNEERAEEHYDKGRKILYTNNPKGYAETVLRS